MRFEVQEYNGSLTREQFLFFEEKRYLNARKQLEFVIDSWAEEYPKDIYIGIKDTDGHEWGVGFEYQPGTIKYCRTFTDPIA